MSRELSTVLDHIEKISELDLDGVEPTSHVIEVENVLRPDEPRPSWPRDRVLARRARRRLGRLPRSHARPVSADAARADRRRGDRARARGRPRRRASCSMPTASGSTGSTASSARSCARPTRAGEPAADAPLGGRAARGQGPLLHGGRPDHRRLAHPRGLQAARTRRPPCASCARPARRCSARPTWTSSRWAPRTRTPATAPSATRGTASACRAARAAARPPPSRRASRPGRSAPTRAARSASPRRSAGSSG